MTTQNIAHRGASRDRPENTLPAFELAVEQGADMIETDLHLLRDGAVVLYHDDEIGRRPVGLHSLGELRQSLPHAPTLEETLDALGQKIAWNLELKAPRSGPYPGLEAHALAQVKRRGILERTLFSSFSDAVLVKLRELEPKARLGTLVSASHPHDILGRAARVRSEALHLELRLATEERVSEAHAAGYRVNVWTVDSAADQRRLIGYGVDGIFTNLPAKLGAILRTQ
ncbi:MAG TPA: glycerophosphodiester phosphodiesterase family protein [Myxococcota bacterium]|nr:glycerophosphodiester phosphodiesterase family protein [Myxococcota bacterium]